MKPFFFFFYSQLLMRQMKKKQKHLNACNFAEVFVLRNREDLIWTRKLTS